MFVKLTMKGNHHPEDGGEGLAGSAQWEATFLLCGSPKPRLI